MLLISDIAEEFLRSFEGLLEPSIALQIEKGTGLEEKPSMLPMLDCEPMVKTDPQNLTKPYIPTSWFDIIMANLI
jgi:hypothetical protein